MTSHSYIFKRNIKCKICLLIKMLSLSIQVSLLWCYPFVSCHPESVGILEIRLMINCIGITHNLVLQDSFRYFTTIQRRRDGFQECFSAHSADSLWNNPAEPATTSDERDLQHTGLGMWLWTRNKTWKNRVRSQFLKNFSSHQVCKIVRGGLNSHWCLEKTEVLP